MHRTRFWPGLRPDPLNELTTLPQSPIVGRGLEHALPIPLPAWMLEASGVSIHSTAPILPLFLKLINKYT